MRRAWLVIDWFDPTIGRGISWEKLARQAASIEKDSYEYGGYRGTLGTRVARRALWLTRRG
jgi:hypothetical protein